MNRLNLHDPDVRLALSIGVVIGGLFTAWAVANAKRKANERRAQYEADCYLHNKLHRLAERVDVLEAGKENAPCSP